MPPLYKITKGKSFVYAFDEKEKEIDKINGNGKEEVSWLVHGSKGSKVTINVYHPKGGRTSKEIKLSR